MAVQIAFPLLFLPGKVFGVLPHGLGSAIHPTINHMSTLWFPCYMHRCTDRQTDRHCMYIYTELVYDTGLPQRCVHTHPHPPTYTHRHHPHTHLHTIVRESMHTNTHTHTNANYYRTGIHRRHVLYGIHIFPPEWDHCSVWCVQSSFSRC